MFTLARASPPFWSTTLPAIEPFDELCPRAVPAAENRINASIISFISFSKLVMKNVLQKWNGGAWADVLRIQQVKRQAEKDETTLPVDPDSVDNADVQDSGGLRDPVRVRTAALRVDDIPRRRDAPAPEPVAEIDSPEVLTQRRARRHWR